MIDNYKGITLLSAKLLQEQFRQHLKFEVPDDTTITMIAGADISFNKDESKLYAAIVVLSYPSMKLHSYALATGETDFPYISGYLGFREVPALLKAWELLTEKPDVIILDGQGILHPRRMGIASHFGVLTRSATIGCAKSSLYGFYEELPLLNILLLKFMKDIVWNISAMPCGQKTRQNPFIFLRDMV
jgi:deoxyribonuclease V